MIDKFIQTIKYLGCDNLVLSKIPGYYFVDKDKNEGQWSWAKMESVIFEDLRECVFNSENKQIEIKEMQIRFMLIQPPNLPLTDQGKVYNSTRFNLVAFYQNAITNKIISVQHTLFYQYCIFD